MERGPWGEPFLKRFFTGYPDRMPDFTLPLSVTEAIEVLEEAGYEAYAVGGCVRDLCRGVLPHDYDITTSATPEECEEVFSGRRIIETGIKHGTVTVIINGEPLEITTYRTDGEYLDGRHPESVTFSRRIEDDLSRRDFTINAMAYSPNRGLVDVFGGRDHIDEGVIACVGEPDKRFGEDGLRIMRALRFASSFGFSIEAATAASIHRNRALLSNISAERILAEYKRLIVGVGARDILTEYEDVMCAVMPELAGHEDYVRAVGAVAKVRTDVNLRTAILLRRGENISALRRLKPDGRMRDSVSRVLELVEGELFGEGVKSTDLCISLRRMLRFCRYDDAYRAVDMARATGRLAPGEASNLTVILSEMEAANECVTVRQLRVNGSDLIALGVNEGERIGEVLDSLLEDVITGRVRNDRGELLNRICKIVGKTS